MSSSIFLFFAAWPAGAAGLACCRYRGPLLVLAQCSAGVSGGRVCVYVFYFYLAACGPKGHGSGDFPSPYRTESHPQPLWVIAGPPYLLLPSFAGQRKSKKVTKERDKGKIRPRAAPARPPRRPAQGPHLGPYPPPPKTSWTTPCTPPSCPPRTQSLPL